jgi:hypothetical protein
MSFPLRSRFDLPLNWTPEQASAVLEFLQSLQDQLWMLYHQDIQNHQQREHSAPVAIPTPPDDSQPPF